MSRAEPARPATLRLVVGAGLGVAIAAAGLLLSARSRVETMPADVVALVNGRPVALAAYRRAASGVASDRREPLGDADRRRVVERLIDEELLIQRGLELGLAHSDHKIRADLAAAVISSVAGEDDSVEPSAAEVERFYAEHGELFQTSARIHLRQIFFHPGAKPDEGMRLADEAVRRLRAGEAFETVRESLGDHEISPLPDAPLPPAKLVDYLGPTVLRAALALGAGEVSEPVQSGQGIHVVLLVARDRAATPPLADVRPQIVAEIRRRRGEAALRAYLERLRRDAVVEIKSDAL